MPRSPSRWLSVTVDDDLSGVLDDAGWVGDEKATSGTLTRTGASLDTLRWVGDLAVGQTVTITYSVIVEHGNGDWTLTNVASSPAGVCVPAADGNPDCTTEHRVGGYVYAKTSDPASLSTVAVGDTITVQNLNSKKILQAVVSGPGQAAVGPAAAELKSTRYALR